MASFKSLLVLMFIMETKGFHVKSPLWVRILQIGIGAVSIAMSVVAIAYPGLAVATAVIVISAILLIAGIEQIAAGLYRRHRIAQIGIGILDIALAVAAIAFPLFASLVVIVLAAIALLFSGISSVLAGIGNKGESRLVMAVNIGVGALTIVVADIALISPFFGAFVVAWMIAIALLIYGMRLITIGTIGERRTMTPTTGAYTDATRAS